METYTVGAAAVQRFVKTQCFNAVSFSFLSNAQLVKN